ncbi:MAG: metal-dependent transcriptional regulator [Clostridia bacterium]|nr:metal-dependent transcriptional regulator [Clostridia bacterium]
MALYESGQMYLEAIYVLSEKNEKIRAVDIGAYLGYSKPSVSRAVGILKRDAYILVDTEGYITMTAKGRQIAEQLYERHTVLTNMLVALGVDEATATEDACRIEHVLSKESFEAIKNHAAYYSAKLEEA